MQTDVFEVLNFPNLTSFVTSKKVSRRLRVCIATEEIVGPVANGGIASTYFDLMRLLVDQGHDVTVLYLKGKTCHYESIDHWIKEFADRGVEFVPLPEAADDRTSAAPFWQNRLYSAWQWLREQPPFDVIHTSEWRGGTYYALLAKKQGLAFRDTLFVVKTSSPHIWNRHYQMRFLEDEQMLGVMYPEQMTVELADMVVGGSAHLLSFMDYVGYKLPFGRVFVQPNVILFDRLNVEDRRPPCEAGDIVTTRELVFFGRLEQRKGLEIFCDTIDFIVGRGYEPSKISFLGKQGTRIPSYPHLKTNEFINMRAKNWPCDIEIHNDLNQHAAISYMLQSPCIALMPSLIENSTMTVYEALVYRIPFIATRVGGTAELISKEYHDRVLCEANPRDLARVLERVLCEGQVIASPAFSNDKNLEIWRSFHEFLAQSIDESSVEQTLEKIAACGGGDSGFKRILKKSPARPISVCVSHLGDLDPLIPLLNALISQEATVYLAVADKDSNGALARYLSGMQSKGVTVIHTHECTLGETFNRLADMAQGDALVFMRSDIHLPHKDFAATLAGAFNNSNAAAFAPMYDMVDSNGFRHQYLTMGGDLALGFFNYSALCGEVIAVRADAFRSVGGFAVNHGLGGLSQNLAVRLINAGYELESIPIALYTEHRAKSRWRLDESSARYLASMPLFENLPLHLKKVLMSVRLGIVEKEMMDLSQVTWKNVSRTVIEEGIHLPRLRIGMDELKHVFGILVDCRLNVNSVPELVVEKNGKVLFKVPMSHYNEKFYAMWSLNEFKHIVAIPKQLPLFLKLFVSHQGEQFGGLMRSLKLVSDNERGVKFFSQMGIEDWPGGKPPRDI